MTENHLTLVERIMKLPILQAEWVLWFLFVLSIVSLGLIAERAHFFMRHRVDVDALRQRLSHALAQGTLSETAAALEHMEALEASVLRGGIDAAPYGPDAVEETVRVVLSRERQRYERGLTVLAVVGSNAPFIGLFGTVLGIIHAFANLATGDKGASKLVMAGVSEALVATAVGLLVAIPAVAAFNFFKARVRVRIEGADQLVRTLLARLKADSPSTSARVKAAA